MTDVSLSGVTASLESESVNLSDVAAEPGGAWPNGWYRATIIEGYATGRGHQFQTGDGVSKKGDSRNLMLCFNVVSATAERNMQESFNYRGSDFGRERLAFIKEERLANKDLKRWPDVDAQRTSLAVAKIGQFQKAIGFTELKLTSEGGIISGVFVGQAVDVRLGVDENGYNVITAFAPAGTKTAARKSA